MTVIEQRTMDAIQSLNRKMRDQHEPDWEQRRYEIAKEIFTRCLSHEDGDVRAFCNRELEMTADNCVRQANALINALKTKEGKK